MIRRRYVDVPDGQLHVMDAGEGRPILLMPWFPLSADMYAGEFPAFVRAGLRPIGVDTLGTGNSQTESDAISITRHAANLSVALQAMDVDAPIVLGGHMASQIAAALCARPEVDASALVLDGGPMVDDTVLKGLFEKMGRVEGALTSHGGGPTPDFLFNQALNTYDIFAPGYEATDENLPTLYRFVRDYLNAYLPKGGAQLVQNTPHDFDFVAALKTSTIPAVILTAETEPLKTSFEPMVAAYGGPIETHIFPGDHPLHHPARQGAFAEGILAALKALSVLT